MENALPKHFFGIGVGSTVAVGSVFLYTDKLLTPIYPIKKEDIENELNRFHKAVEESKKQIFALQTTVEEGISQILSMHIVMLEDKVIHKEIVDSIEEQLHNIDHIYNNIMDKYIEKLSSLSDATLAERANDIVDIKHRVLKNLSGSNSDKLSGVPKKSIIIAQNLTPSNTLNFHNADIAGFILETGGATSHTAILAKALGIPAIFGISDIIRTAKNGDMVIVDSVNNLVILNPNKEEIEKYKSVKEEIDAQRAECLILSKGEAKTKDGVDIAVLANLDIPEETDNALKYGASGVGLYRTEFLYLYSDNNIARLPSEDEQFEVYKTILEKVQTSVVIRTLDLGGDKVFPDGMQPIKDKNPFLGWRAIRFCLANTEIFKTQLRAILRASAYGKAKIMIPMISTVEEVIETKDLIEECKQELKNLAIKFDENIKIGVLIETPSAALSSDIISKYSDFISIGSNDLIQYTLACDRTNEKINYLYNPLDVAVLKLIKYSIDSANKNNLEITLCGEMAGTVLYTPILLGLGLRSFSMSALSIPDIKKCIRSLSIKDCEKLAGDVFESGRKEDIENIINTFFKENVSF